MTTLSGIYMATTKRRVASVGTILCGRHIVPRHEPMNETTAVLIRLQNTNFITSITLPPKQPRRWYRITTYIDN